MLLLQITCNMKLWDCLASHNRALVKEGDFLSLGVACPSLYFLSTWSGNGRAAIVL